MRAFFLLVALVIALPAHADGESLRDRADRRRMERLHRMNAGAEHSPAPQTVRVGRTTRRIQSPRRGGYAEEGTVFAVADGSVFGMEDPRGERREIRLLGANAPVIHSASPTQECYAREARDALIARIRGESVFLEHDGTDRRDEDGRRVRYARIDGTDVSAWLIEEGYAFSDRDNAHARQDFYTRLEDEAREEERGLWSTECTYNPEPRLRFPTE